MIHLDFYRAKQNMGPPKTIECFGCGHVIPYPTPNQRDALRPLCGSDTCKSKARAAERKLPRRFPKPKPKLKYFVQM